MQSLHQTLTLCILEPSWPSVSSDWVNELIIRRLTLWWSGFRTPPPPPRHHQLAQTGPAVGCPPGPYQPDSHPQPPFPHCFSAGWWEPWVTAGIITNPLAGPWISSIASPRNLLQGCGPWSLGHNPSPKNNKDLGSWTFVRAPHRTVEPLVAEALLLQRLFMWEPLFSPADFLTSYLICLKSWSQSASGLWVALFMGAEQRRSWQMCPDLCLHLGSPTSLAEMLGLKGCLGSASPHFWAVCSPYVFIAGCPLPRIWPPGLFSQVTIADSEIHYP